MPPTSGVWRWCSRACVTSVTDRFLLRKEGLLRGPFFCACMGVGQEVGACGLRLTSRTDVSGPPSSLHQHRAGAPALWQPRMEPPTGLPRPPALLMFGRASRKMGLISCFCLLVAGTPNPACARSVSEKRRELKQNSRGETPGRSNRSNEDQASCLNTSRAAATVAAMSSAVCAALTKPASYSAGAVYTPRSSRPWNSVLNFAPSVFITVA